MKKADTSAGERNRPSEFIIRSVKLLFGLQLSEHDDLNRYGHPLMKLWFALLLPEVGSHRVRAPLRKRVDAVAVQP